MRKITKEKIAMMELRLEKGFERLQQSLAEMKQSFGAFSSCLDKVRDAKMKMLKEGTKLKK